MLTKQELLLVGHMLVLASNQFSSHCCNDLESTVVDQLTEHEWAGIRQAIAAYEWNEDTEPAMPGDDTLMSYLADRMFEAAEKM